MNEIELKDLSKKAEISSSLPQMPSVDFRLHTANMLLKLDEFKKSVKILDTII
jgi:hypothetical protein